MLSGTTAIQSIIAIRYRQNWRR